MRASIQYSSDGECTSPTDRWTTHEINQIKNKRQIEGVENDINTAKQTGVRFQHFCSEIFFII